MAIDTLTVTVSATLSTPLKYAALLLKAQQYRDNPNTPNVTQLVEDEGALTLTLTYEQPIDFSIPPT